MNRTLSLAVITLGLLGGLSSTPARSQPQPPTTQSEVAVPSRATRETRELPGHTAVVGPHRHTLTLTLRFTGGCSRRRFMPFYRMVGTTAELWFRNESTPEACDAGPDHVLTVSLPDAVQRAQHLDIVHGADVHERVW